MCKGASLELANPSLGISGTHTCSQLRTQRRKPRQHSPAWHVHLAPQPCSLSLSCWPTPGLWPLASPHVWLLRPALPHHAAPPFPDRGWTAASSEQPLLADSFSSCPLSLSFFPILSLSVSLSLSFFLGAVRSLSPPPLRLTPIPFHCP